MLRGPNSGKGDQGKRRGEDSLFEGMSFKKKAIPSPTPQDNHSPVTPNGVVACSPMLVGSPIPQGIASPMFFASPLGSPLQQRNLVSPIKENVPLSPSFPRVAPPPIPTIQRDGDKLKEDLTRFDLGINKNPLNFAKMSVQEFSDFCDLSRNIFTNKAFSNQSFNDKLRSIWLQMTFSLFVRHFADKQEHKAEKLKLLDALDKAILPELVNAVRSINNMPMYTFTHVINRENHREPRGLHVYQELLWIHWNLLRYYQAVIPSADLIDLPLGFCTEKLAHSQLRAKEDRENNTKAVTGHWEAMVNATIGKFLGAGTQIQTLKEERQACYIDRETGLELDLPLTHRLSVETDGVHHFQHNIHTPLHTFKSLAFRESGGQRLPFDLDAKRDFKGNEKIYQDIASLYGDILRNQAVIDYLTTTDELNSFREDVKKTMLQMQEHFNLSPIKGPARDYFNWLLSVDKKLRTLIDAKPLETLLQQAAQSAKNLGNSKLMNDYLKSRQYIYHLNAQLTQNQKEFTAVKNQIAHDENLKKQLLNLSMSQKMPVTADDRHEQQRGELDLAKRIKDINSDLKKFSVNSDNLRNEEKKIKDSIAQEEASLQKLLETFLQTEKLKALLQEQRKVKEVCAKVYASDQEEALRAQSAVFTPHREMAYKSQAATLKRVQLEQLAPFEPREKFSLGGAGSKP